MNLFTRCNCHTCYAYLQRWEMHHADLCVECAEQMPEVMAVRSDEFRHQARDWFRRDLTNLTLGELVDLDTAKWIETHRKAS